MDAPCSTGDPRGVSTPSSLRLCSTSSFLTRLLGRDLDFSDLDSKFSDSSTMGSRPSKAGLSSALLSVHQPVANVECGGRTIQTPVVSLPFLLRPAIGDAT